MTKLIINCETGEETLRDLLKAEKDQQKVDEQQTLELQAEQAEVDAKRQVILDLLGLTADEAKLLLG